MLPLLQMHSPDLAEVSCRIFQMVNRNVSGRDFAKLWCASSNVGTSDKGGFAVCSCGASRKSWNGLSRTARDSQAAALVSLALVILPSEAHPNAFGTGELVLMRNILWHRCTPTTCSWDRWQTPSSRGWPCTTTNPWTWTSSGLPCQERHPGYLVSKILSLPCGNAEICVVIFGPIVFLAIVASACCTFDRRAVQYLGPGLNPAQAMS